MTQWHKGMRWLACTILLVAATAVRAAPVTYSFSVTATDGPLAGASSTGTFTFDSSIVLQGPNVFQTGLFTDVSFLWDGILWDETTIDSSFLGFNADGTLYGALFGTNCGPSGFGCGLNADPLPLSQWFFGISDGVGIFGYFALEDRTDQYFTTIVALSPVPTPGTLPLAFLALSLLGLSRGRIRRA